MTNGYFQEPAVHGHQLVFRADDNFWTCDLSGGLARQLTQCRSVQRNPRISPNGKWLAFSGKEDGVPEIMVMPLAGGSLRRLTYCGPQGATAIGWTPDSESVIFTTNAWSPLRGWNLFYTISLEGGQPVNMDLGWGASISFAPDGSTIIGRFGRDPAHWKQYRGGCMGEIWCDFKKRGEFLKLFELQSNLTHPVWIHDRIYFVGDHTGIGNVFSCNVDGENITQHTFHSDFYVRNPQTDGTSIVYQSGGRLFRLNPENNTVEQIKISLPSTYRQRQIKMPSLEKHLESIDIDPSNTYCLAIARGKLFHFAYWHGGVRTYGITDGSVRYRLARWLNCGKRFVAVTDESGEEQLAVFEADTLSPPRLIDNIPIGRISHLQVVPGSNTLIMTNNRYQVIEIDIDTGSYAVIDQDRHQRRMNFDISRDGRWIAFPGTIDPHRMAIKVFDRHQRTTHVITNPVLVDRCPVFDPAGKCLYFLSSRVFNPVRDNLDFNYSFPNGMIPMALPLQFDQINPFEPVPEQPFDSKETAQSNQTGAQPQEGRDSNRNTIEPVNIDFDGICDRAVAMPIQDGIYLDMRAGRDRVWLLESSVTGLLPRNTSVNGESRNKLAYYDSKTKSYEPYADGVDAFFTSRDGRVIGYRSPGRLRVLDASKNPAKNDVTGFNKKSGWIDLSRLKAVIHPLSEWRQMYREAWRLMRDEYYAEDMSGVDWQAVYDRYLPLVEQCGTRSDLSDIIWESYGELGTSHSYEFGGDYEPAPDLAPGMLGVDFEYDVTRDRYLIKHIVRGDAWEPESNSPLNQPGLNVKPGCFLLAINGQAVSGQTPPGRLLLGIKNQWVTLTVSNDETSRDIQVKTIAHESSARLREWVNRTTEYVHSRTDNLVGYLYLQDMGSNGFAQFHRAWLAESHRDAIIIDVRHNGGGHVSSLLLEKLSRKQLGFCTSRYGEITSEPPFCARGPLVTICDEFSGSDGDLFAHKFKLMKLGTLVGKRTWGGVVGISPQISLVDGTIVTQPEFYHWFTDVGWNLENCGAVPDVPVDLAPHDFTRGDDPQLEKAISIAVKQLEIQPPLKPDLGTPPHHNRL